MMKSRTLHVKWDNIGNLNATKKLNYIKPIDKVGIKCYNDIAQKTGA